MVWVRWSNNALRAPLKNLSTFGFVNHRTTDVGFPQPLVTGPVDPQAFYNAFSCAGFSNFTAANNDWNRVSHPDHFAVLSSWRATESR